MPPQKQVNSVKPKEKGPLWPSPDHSIGKPPGSAEKSKKKEPNSIEAQWEDSVILI